MLYQSIHFNPHNLNPFILRSELVTTGGAMSENSTSYVDSLNVKAVPSARVRFVPARNSVPVSPFSNACLSIKPSNEAIVPSVSDWWKEMQK